jgi:predicted permease
MLSTAWPLVFCLGAGFGFGALRVFRAPDDAVKVLNGYALYLAFPALVFVGIYRSTLALSAGFVLATVVPFVVLVAALALIRRLGLMRGEHAAATGFGSVFGNVAYFGIPLVGSVMGTDMIGLASCSAALHILVGLTVGPVLLLAWGSDGDKGGKDGVLARLVRQPLLWAPIVGFAARVVPESRLIHVVQPLSWVAESAAPVAVFMVGLYLWTRRRQCSKLRAPDAVLVASKLIVFPGLTWLCAWWLMTQGWLDVRSAQIVVMQAAMPVAITTFSIAEAYDVGQDHIARGIIATTVLFLVALPGLVALVGLMGA